MVIVCISLNNERLIHLPTRVWLYVKLELMRSYPSREALHCGLDIMGSGCVKNELTKSTRRDDNGKMCLLGSHKFRDQLLLDKGQLLGLAIAREPVCIG